MTEGTTTTGFDFHILESAADDWELMEELGQLEEKPFLAASILKRLLGAEQMAALKEHLRGEDGVVHSTAMLKELSEIMTAKPVKN